LKEYDADKDEGVSALIEIIRKEEEKFSFVV
jgi:hypothetical protein